MGASKFRGCRSQTAFRSWETLSEERSEAGPTVQVVQALVRSRRRCRRRLSKFDQRAPIPIALFWIVTSSLPAGITRERSSACSLAEI